LDGTTVASGNPGQRINIEQRPIGQRVYLQIAPDILHGVKFRGIGRKEVNMEVWGVPDECLNLLGPMSLQPIPH